MCYKSPAKLLRSVRRITKFIELKPDPLSSLQIKHVSSIDIAPTKKCRPNLSAALMQQTEIPPKSKLLSFHAATVIDIPPYATMPCLPTSLPQARLTSPSLAPPPPWSAQNCLPSHLRPRPSLVSPFASRPYPTGPPTTSKPTKSLLQSLWWCSYCSIFLPTWKVFCSPLCA